MLHFLGEIGQKCHECGAPGAIGRCYTEDGGRLAGPPSHCLCYEAIDGAHGGPEVTNGAGAVGNVGLQEAEGVYGGGGDRCVRAMGLVLLMLLSLASCVSRSCHAHWDLRRRALLLLLLLRVHGPLMCPLGRRGVCCRPGGCWRVGLSCQRHLYCLHYGIGKGGAGLDGIVRAPVPPLAAAADQGCLHSLYVAGRNEIHGGCSSPTPIAAHARTASGSKDSGKKRPR